ncbi:MAG: hypothetical protein B7Y12_06910 [Rhizobiales bacterium 24-66-13]|nr:MAG: hypothetical protein B7Y12_06910 [Rhizobiales bacterium 24-66-13]OZB10063.1 MAG: hypothetical protein B7X67_06485 [Rhizobiales bacterium 39-66-18]
MTDLLRPSTRHIRFFFMLVAELSVCIEHHMLDCSLEVGSSLQHIGKNRSQGVEMPGFMKQLSQSEIGRAEGLLTARPSLQLGDGLPKVLPGLFDLAAALEDEGIGNVEASE